MTLAEKVRAGVRFVEQGHQYFLTDGGLEVPANTTALEGVGVTPDYSKVPHDILVQARDRGTGVHIATAYDDQRVLNESSCSDEILGHVEGWRRYRRERGFVPILIEQPVYIGPGNPRCMPCAGTLDRAGYTDDCDAIVLDIKSMQQKPSHVGPQTAGYSLMARESGLFRARERWCVRTFKDGTYRADKLVDPQDYNVFLYAVWLWHWRREHGR